MRRVIPEGTRKIKSQYTGGILLQPVQKLVATLIFALTCKGKNANESLPVAADLEKCNLDAADAALVLF